MDDDGTSMRVAQLTQFIRDENHKVEAYLRHMGASVPDAQDCAQEAMIELSKKWGSIKNPHLWVYTVASRKYLKTRSRPQCKREVSAGIVPEQICSTLPPEARIAGAESDVAAESILENLSDSERRVMAGYMYGFTAIEIARMHGMTRQSVWKAQSRARAKLRQRLDQQRRGEDRR